MDKYQLKQIIKNKTPTVLTFLDPYEISYIKNLTNDVYFFGGYNDSERKRAYLFTDPLDDIVCLKIDYNERFCKLRHQDILGALLALGLPKKIIGDILPTQKLFFVTKEKANVILYSLEKIASCKVNLSIIANHNAYSESKHLYFSIIVSSMRLDIIIAKITRLSRNEALYYINQGFVKINHQVVKKNTKSIKK